MHSWEKNKLIECNVTGIKNLLFMIKDVDTQLAFNFPGSSTPPPFYIPFLASWSCPQHISITNMDQHPTESTLKRLLHPSLHCTSSVAEKSKWVCAFKGGGVIYSSLSVMTLANHSYLSLGMVEGELQYPSSMLHCLWHCMAERDTWIVSKRSCLWGVGVDHD